MFAPFVPTPTAIIIIIGPCWSTGCDHPQNANRRYDCRDSPHDHLLALMLAALRHANEPTPKLRQDRDEFAAGLWRPNSDAGCLRRCSFRRSGRGQRFDALAAPGRQQSDTVILERCDPVGMAQNRCQIGCVGPEAFLRAAPIVKIHPILWKVRISTATKPQSRRGKRNF
jgi:hypothetical protein